MLCARGRAHEWKNTRITLCTCVPNEKKTGKRVQYPDSSPVQLRIRAANGYYIGRERGLALGTRGPTELVGLK